LGFFVEVEAPDEARIDGLLGRLGLGNGEILTTSYVRLLLERLGESANKAVRFAD
jgi:hypothetical protein